MRAIYLVYYFKSTYYVLLYINIAFMCEYLQTEFYLSNAVPLTLLFHTENNGEKYFKIQQQNLIPVGSL